MRSFARWLHPVTCLSVTAMYLTVQAAGVVAALRLGHWPRPSIDDPKYEHVLGALPLLYELALSFGVALWGGVMSGALPLAAVLLLFSSRPGGALRTSLPIYVFAVACVAALRDIGNTICWLLD